MRRLGALLAVLLVASASSRARAQETAHTGLPTEEMPVADAIVDPTMKRSWGGGDARSFAALTLDAGYLYLRPRVSAGWGLPFAKWIGVDVNPILVGSGWGGYGGARFAIPYVDFRVGARYFAAFQHSYLAPADSYSRIDLDSTERASAKITTLEAELTGAVPVGPGEIIGLFSLSDVIGTPPSSYVFEETLRVIVAPPLVWRARAGYALRVGEHGQHSIGLVADLLDVPKRDDSITVRAGPVLRIGLSRHFEVRGSFVVTLVSPDRLGLVGGDFTELGVRWRTATE